MDKAMDLKSSRDGFGKALLEIGKENNNIVALSADLAESTRVKAFAHEYPQRFVQVGVAEQNLMGVAAGLALSGKIPFATSFSAFNPGRNWDQLRVSVAYQNLNVKVIGSHSGLTVGPDGATHQALEDIAITRVIPNLSVIVPADYNQAYQATKAISEILGPIYLRLSRPNLPIFTTSEFKFGKADLIREGKDLSIFATGTMVYQAILVADMLKDKLNIKAEVVNIHTIKPVDKEAIVRSASKTKRVVTIEEHQIFGGLGAAVLEVLAENPIPLKVLGVQDTFGESAIGHNELWDKYGLSVNKLFSNIRHFITTSTLNK